MSYIYIYIYIYIYDISNLRVKRNKKGHKKVENIFALEFCWNLDWNNERPITKKAAKPRSFNNFSPFSYVDYKNIIN
jgi:hypothetical protein